MHVARKACARHSLVSVITLCCDAATRGDRMTIEAQQTAETVAATDAPAVAVAHPQTWQANLARLQGLAEVLTQHGLRARLMTPPGRVPSLHVVNPCASALAEDVYAGRGQDGLWWFWWSWAEQIAAGEDVEGAASMIEHVLAATG